MTVALSNEEREYLINMLGKEIKELREEIHHTHTSTFKDDLKAKEEMVRHLLDKVSTASS